MKRRVTPALVIVAAATVVNVAVAWSGAVWGTAAPGVHATPLSGDARWVRDVPAEWPAPVSGGSDHSLMMTAHVYSGGDVKRQVAAGTPIWFGQSVFQYGYPLRCMEGEFQSTIRDPYARRQVRVALVPVSDLLRPRNMHRVIPLRPIWIPFIVNTLVFAGLIWSLVFVAIAWRSGRRRRRGQCPRCAYPRGASPVCSECGAALFDAGVI